MAEQPLSGIRVLELADGAAGGFCGRQFAAWGAQVVMLEPPAGGALRALGPRWRCGDIEGSAAFEMLAAGKLSAPLADAGRLLAHADVLICDAPADEIATRLGHDLDSLRDRHPDLVQVIITPGAGADQTTTAELEAVCGYLSLNGPADGAPLLSPAHVMAHAIGVNAFLGALAALIGRERLGGANQVWVSGLQTLANFVMWLREQHQDAPTRRSGGTPEGARLLRCADGLVSCAPAVEPHLAAYREVLGVPDDIVLGVLSSGDRQSNADAAAEAFAPYAAKLSTEEVFLGLQVRGVACGKVQSLEEVLQDRQLDDRGFFDTLQHPVLGRLPLPGRPVRMTGAPGLAPTPACRPATSSIEGLGWTPRPRKPAAVPSAEPPLAGLRVLDLTQAWIGPMAAIALADLGAEVIKVEGLARPDVWRFLGQAAAHPGSETAAVNRSWYFNGTNRSKLGLGLDLRQPAGADAFLRLLPTVDILLENFTPQVMPRFGLGYERLTSVRPDLIMTSFSGYGAFGAHAGFKTNGAAIEAMAGWNALHRDAAGRPVSMGGYPADPICGLQMAACTLVALFRRLRTGEGAHVDGAMMEAAAGYIGDALLAQAMRASGAEIVDDEPPAQVRPATAPDAWVVVTGGRTQRVNTTWEALDAPELAGWFLSVRSAGLGVGSQAGPLWRFADSTLRAPTPPPRIGEHTREVLAGVLSVADLDALIAHGVAGSVD